MTIRRRAALTGAVLAGAALLAACEQPTPIATVTVGTETVHSEAACYNDGKKIPQSELRSCIQAQPGETVTVHSGDKLRFGLEPEAADHGWYLAIDGQPVTDPMKETYRSYDGDAFFQANPQTGQRSKQVTVSIVEGSLAKGHYGVWNVKVEMAG